MIITSIEIIEIIETIGAVKVIEILCMGGPCLFESAALFAARV